MVLVFRDGEMCSVESEKVDVSRAWCVLETVMDPEIPDLSVIDLGMIVDVRVADGRAVVRMTPTFAACPALELLCSTIVTALRDGGFADASVDIVFDPPWSTDRITDLGLEKLRLFGLAPPSRMDGRGVEMKDLVDVPCPFCDSSNTTLESTFGSTLCRSIHYCNACQQSFEHMKPVTQ